MIRAVRTLIPAAAAAFLGFTPVHAQSDDPAAGAGVPKPLRAALSNTISLPGGKILHATPNAVANQRLVRVPGSATVVALWEEANDAGAMVPHYALSLDGRSLSGRVRENPQTIDLQYASFDPLRAVPPVDQRFAATPGNDVYLVQFVIWPLPEFRAGLEAMGARVVRFLPENTVAVRMSPDLVARVRALPQVRWVGEHHPAYRIDPNVLAALVAGTDAQIPARYSIECFERGMADQGKVADAVIAMGGIVDVHTPDQFRMEASLTRAQLLAVARMNEVNWIEPWGGPPQYDMNNVRAIGGANFIEATLGFTGQGVRGEVFDSELRTTHQEFAVITPVAHSATFDPGDIAHGSCSYSAVFASGVVAVARGMLPDAQEGYFYNDDFCTQFGGAETRLTANSELVNPALGFQCVFQTSSIGSIRTTTYTAISAEVDDYLFITQLLSTQSQSNAGWNGEIANNSRPQAWAKNIVSVGGVYSEDNAVSADDHWISVASNCGEPTTNVSSGPASDTRIKPDLCFYCDCVDTAIKTSDVSYTEFNGTSSATPMTGGHFGLFFQMWHEGVWKGRGGKSSVFASRAKMTTAKAALINTAFQYNWPGGGANGDLTRVRQGWGRPNLQTLYELRNKTFIVDEEDVLAPLATRTYTVLVGPAEPNLRVTMCYVDPQGNPAVQATHRVNDLSLRVTSPAGVVYWGNNGLLAGLTSVAGGASNTKDTVENVYLASPAAGVWTIEVLGDVITQDSHTETAAVDADFSIWATGCTEFNLKKAPTYGYSVESNGNDHLYRINMDTGEATDLGLVGNVELEGLSFGPNGELFAVDGSAAAQPAGSLDEFWNITLPPGSQVGVTGARNGIDAGMDYFNGTMYNIQGDAGGSSLYRINTSTGTAVLIGSNAIYFGDLSIDGLGNAYATDGLTDNLYSINLSNAAAALIGPLGHNVGGLGSSFAPDGTLWAVSDGGDIYTINTATGAATFRAQVTIAGAVATGFEGLAIDKNSASVLTALPAFASTISNNNTGGLYFTSPVNAILSGLRVPNEASQSIQNVEVVRFTAGVPPTFPVTTNSFVSLGRFENQPADRIIPCSIPVSVGDVIGVLGACGTATMNFSYSSVNSFASSIKGVPVTLNRLAMLHNLYAQAPADLWTQAVNPVTRVEMYFQDGRQNLYLNGDQPAAGSNLVAAPLANQLGATTFTHGELSANSGNDPELIAAGAQGNCLDGLTAPNPTANCDLNFNFDVDAITFLYGGNTGGMTMEAYNGAGALVDSFSQADTSSGEPAGPRTLAAAGIRRLRWFESIGGNFAALDNIRIHATYECWANCDHSTTPPILNVLDFGCYLNAFAAGDLYANCDGSTTPPALNVLDFGCFLNRFAAGCN